MKVDFIFLYENLVNNKSVKIVKTLKGFLQFLLSFQLNLTISTLINLIKRGEVIYRPF